MAVNKKKKNPTLATNKFSSSARPTSTPATRTQPKLETNKFSTSVKKPSIADRANNAINKGAKAVGRELTSGSRATGIPERKILTAGIGGVGAGAGKAALGATKLLAAGKAQKLLPAGKTAAEAAAAAAAAAKPGQELLINGVTRAAQRAEGGSDLLGTAIKNAEAAKVAAQQATGAIRAATSTSARAATTVTKAGTEYTSARAALNAGDITGFARSVKNVALSRKMIDAAFLNKAGQVSPLKTLGAVGTAGFLMAKMIDTYPFAEWGRIEAQEIMKFARTEARKTGDPALMAEAKELQDELLDRNVWERIAEKIPWVNTKEAFMEKFDAIEFQAKVTNHAEDSVDEKIASGAAGDVGAAIVQTKEETEAIQTQEANARVDYYNQERLRTEELIRQAELANRNEDAAFWRAEKDRSFRREAEERVKAGEYWLAYKQQLQALQEDNAPSSLSFGLL